MVINTIVIVLILAVAVVILFAFKASQSKKAQPRNTITYQDQQPLQACGTKPNCVCSEYADYKEFYIAPYQYSDEVPTTKLRQAIKDLGGVITAENTDYIFAQFSTKLFGFVDDVDIRIDRANKRIHFRSQSRVGHSDLGANRQRINQLKALLNQN